MPDIARAHRLAVEPAGDPPAPDPQHAVGRARTGQPQAGALAARPEAPQRPAHAHAGQVLDCVAGAAPGAARSRSIDQRPPRRPPPCRSRSAPVSTDDRNSTVTSTSVSSAAHDRPAARAPARRGPAAQLAQRQRRRREREEERGAVRDSGPERPGRARKRRAALRAQSLKSAVSTEWPVLGHGQHLGVRPVRGRAARRLDRGAQVHLPGQHQHGHVRQRAPARRAVGRAPATPPASGGTCG